jgi:DNA-directed RNA polymerase subunit M/transcription elongation factor TFIIS
MSLKALTGKQQIKKPTAVPTPIAVKKTLLKKTNPTNGELFIKSLSMIKGSDASSYKSTIELILKNIGLTFSEEANISSKMLIYQLISEGIIINELNSMDEIMKRLKKLIEKQSSFTMRTKKSIIEELISETKTENDKKIINDRKNQLEDFIEDYLSKSETTKLFPNIEENKINEKNVINNIDEIVKNYDKNKSSSSNLYNILPTLELNRINYRIQKDILRNKPLVTEGFYNCRKCNSKRTIDYQQQKRSGDEPMNVKVECLDCKYSWQEC